VSPSVQGVLVLVLQRTGVQGGLEYEKRLVAVTELLGLHQAAEILSYTYTETLVRECPRLATQLMGSCTPHPAVVSLCFQQCRCARHTTTPLINQNYQPGATGVVTPVRA
jgi:hypothetical protein